MAGPLSLHSAPRGPQPPVCRPERHLCSLLGPAPHAVGAQTAIAGRRGRGQRAPAAAPGSRAHPRGIGPAPGQRLAGGRDRPTHIWWRLFKRLRSSSCPPPPERLGASSQLFLFYQGVCVGSLKPPLPRQDSRVTVPSAQGHGASAGLRVSVRAGDPGRRSAGSARPRAGPRQAWRRARGWGQGRSGGWRSMLDTHPARMCLLPPVRQMAQPSSRSLRVLWAGGLAPHISQLRSKEDPRESWGQTRQTLLCPFGRLLPYPTLSRPVHSDPREPGQQAWRGAAGGTCSNGPLPHPPCH